MPQAPLVVIVAGKGTVKEKAEQWLRDVAKKWRVRTEGSGVAHGGNVVYIVMDKTRRAALCIEGASVMRRVKSRANWIV